MSFQQDAMDFVHRLQTLYLEQRAMEALLPAFNEDTTWIGTGKQEWCGNRSEARAALLREQSEYSQPFTILEAHYDAQVLSETVCLVYGQVTARPQNKEVADLSLRVSALCLQTPQGLKLAHLHVSTPDSAQEQDRYFVARGANEQTQTLRLRANAAMEELYLRNTELEALTENIPGGVCCCKYDSELTLVSMSHSVQVLFGYAPAEIQALFHDHLLELVYPEDQRAVRHALQTQLAEGDTVEVEYRVLCKNGVLMWVLGKGKRIPMEDGTQRLYCVMLNMDGQKKKQEELRLSLERHQIILNQTTDIIFEWDMKADTLNFSSNWRKKFGYDPLRQNIRQELPRSPNIHPDDKEIFLKLMEESSSGKPYSETEFRVLKEKGVYRWCRIRASVQYSERGQPIKAVGVISDIDAEKKQKERLVAMAQTDALTGLYNKATIQELVMALAGKGKYGYQMLMIIDVDNFKAVNDTYGHMCGDSLLSDVAAVLKHCFRVTDLVGRVGGDEFLVYLPEIDSKKSAQDKATAVMRTLRQVRPNKEAAPISCSIGIAFFPQNSGDFYALYKCADRALYSIKNDGKKGFRFYDPKTCSDALPCGRARSAISESIDSEIVNTVDQQLVQYTFQMLYKSVDTYTAVNQLLEIVGRAYEVSRAYIYESSEDGTHCSNTFEWCNKNVKPAIENMQNLNYQKDLGDYLSNFNEEGVFYCRDTNTLNPQLRSVLEGRQARALLQCALVDDQTWKGYVGFDECQENRRWTSQQVDSLSLIANVLSTFLLKMRLKERLAQLKQQYNRLAETQTEPRTPTDLP